MSEPVGYRETAMRIREAHRGAELLNVPEAAAELGITRKTFMVNQPIPLRKVGRSYGVSVNDLALFLTKQSAYRVYRGK